MVGFRVFDVGLLIVWLIWFFRLRDDDDDSHGDDGGGGEGPEPRPGKDGPGGDGIRLPLGRWRLGNGRDRSHGGPPRPAAAAERSHRCASRCRHACAGRARRCRRTAARPARGQQLRHGGWAPSVQAASGRAE